MNKTIPVLIAIMIISTTIGSATAIVIPVNLQVTDNVKLYTLTFTQNFQVGAESLEFFEFCDDGDTFISGDLQTTLAEEDTEGPLGTRSPSVFIVEEYSVVSNTAEGYRIFFTSLNITTANMVLVCGKVVPTMAIGGMLLEPDTTVLVLAYGIVNAFWLAPMLAGIGVGIYLVKRRF